MLVNSMMIQFSPPCLSPQKRHVCAMCLFAVRPAASLAGSASCEALFPKASLRDEVGDAETLSDRTPLAKLFLADTPRKQVEELVSRGCLRKK